MQLYHSGTKIEIFNDKTEITVDGKNVDISSPEGKKIIKEMNQKMIGLDKIIDSILKSAEKIKNKVEKVFEI